MIPTLSRPIIVYELVKQNEEVPCMLLSVVFYWYPGEIQSLLLIVSFWILIITHTQKSLWSFMMEIHMHVYLSAKCMGATHYINVIYFKSIMQVKSQDVMTSDLKAWWCTISVLNYCLSKQRTLCSLHFTEAKYTGIMLLHWLHTKPCNMFFHTSRLTIPKGFPCKIIRTNCL